MNDFKMVVAGIVFVLWIALSFGVYAAMTAEGLGEWWQIVIPLCVLWLFYAGIVRILQGDMS